MLYPTYDIPYPNGPYCLESGRLGLLQFTVEAGESKTFKMWQMIPDFMHMPQDQSIRCWISEKKGGGPIVLMPINANTWHLSELQFDYVTVHDKDIVPPEGCAVPIPVSPGAYWLNALNLVNEKNVFGMVITGA